MRDRGIQHERGEDGPVYMHQNAYTEQLNPLTLSSIRGHCKQQVNLEEAENERTGEAAEEQSDSAENDFNLGI